MEKHDFIFGLIEDILSFSLKIFLCILFSVAFFTSFATVMMSELPNFCQLIK